MIKLGIEIVQLIFNQLDFKSKFVWLQVISTDARYANISKLIISIPISITVTTARGLIEDKDVISIDDFVSYLEYDCTFNVKFKIEVLTGEYMVYNLMNTYSHKIDTFSIDYLCPISKVLIEPNWYDKLIGINFSYNDPPSILALMLPRLHNLRYLSDYDSISQLPKSIQKLEVYGGNDLKCDPKDLPNSLTDLHLDIFNASYSELRPLITNNRMLRSLYFVGVEDIVAVIEDLKNLPKLTRFTTDATFDLLIIEHFHLNYLEIQASYKSTDISLNLIQLKLDSLSINPDIGVFKNCNLKYLSVEKVHLEKTGDIEFCELLVELHLHRLSIANLLKANEIDGSALELDGSFIKLPPRLKCLTLTTCSINRLENIPQSIEELSLINNKIKSIGTFREYGNLHTLKLDGNPLETLLIEAANLKTLSLMLTPLKHLIVNDGIENINTSYSALESIERIANWDKLTKLKTVEFLNPKLKAIRNIQFPFSLEKAKLQSNLLQDVHFRSENVTELILQILEPRTQLFVNVSFPKVQRLSILTGREIKVHPSLFSFLQNMKVRELILNSTMDTTVESPLLLPSTIEKLSLAISSQEIHLEFPPDSHTNVKEINIKSNSRNTPYSQFSLHSLGHGKNNCFHNQLQHISSDSPPIFSSSANTRVQEVINDKLIKWESYEWDTSLLWEIFYHEEISPSLILLIHRSLSPDRWKIVHPKYRELENEVYERVR